MYTVVMAASWSEEDLDRLVQRRKRFSREETELLEMVKSFTPDMWKDEAYRWLGKEYKEQIKYCQQNIKCCTMLLDYFSGKAADCDVSEPLKPIFLLCCAEL